MYMLTTLLSSNLQMQSYICDIKYHQHSVYLSFHFHYVRNRFLLIFLKTKVMVFRTLNCEQMTNVSYI